MQRLFVEQCREGGTTAAELETAEKLGFDTGITAAFIRSTKDRALPVYIANFVLMDYGTGAVMARAGSRCSATSSLRGKYGLPIRRVVAPTCRRRPTRR